jgi:hypothetical protein
MESANLARGLVCLKRFSLVGTTSVLTRLPNSEVDGDRDLEAVEDCTEVEDSAPVVSRENDPTTVDVWS